MAAKARSEYLSVMFQVWLNYIFFVLIILQLYMKHVYVICSVADNIKTQQFTYLHTVIISLHVYLDLDLF
jgi:hypothetical protein